MIKPKMSIHLVLSVICLVGCQTQPQSATSNTTVITKNLAKPLSIDELMANNWWLVSLTDNNNQLIDLDKIHQIPIESNLNVIPNHGGYDFLTQQPYLIGFSFGCNGYTTGMSFDNNQIKIQESGTISTAISCGKVINELDDKLVHAMQSTKHVEFNRNTNLLTFYSSDGFQFVWRPYAIQGKPDFDKIKKYEWRLVSANDNTKNPIKGFNLKYYSSWDALTTHLHFKQNNIIYTVGCHTVSQNISETNTGFSGIEATVIGQQTCPNLAESERLLINKLTGYNEVRWTEQPNDKAYLYITTADNSELIWHGQLKK